MNHWLLNTAAAVGIVQPGQIASGSGRQTTEIWDELERVSGLSEADLVTRIAARLKLPQAQELKPDPRALKVLPEKLALQHSVLPLAESNTRLTVATADPMDFSAEQAVAFASGRAVDFQLAGPRAIERALRDAYTSDNIDALVAGLDDNLTDAVVALQDDENPEFTTQDIDAKPIVKLTNLILSDAIRDRASDIHIQPVNAVGVVRFRIDGVMRNVMQLPLSAVGRVISRIKVLSQMDIADRVRPQDGRARLQIRGREYDLRISTVPVSGGEKAVIRVLSQASSTRIAELGLPQNEKARLERLLHQRDGIIAVTGPTGSGKTTTLYAALRELATGETNIVTVEDPIEYRLAGISQMQADPKRGVTFASALRAVMRQDPDVILIGEMRDEETAGIGVQAAMTGHLVLATLHTNDAVGTIARLIDLGVDRGALADNLRGALGQRLLRKLCTACKGKGCHECNQIGYRGRLPVLEVLVVNNELQQLITAGASSADLQRAAIAGGMRTLRQVALDYVEQGLTSKEELDRVLGGHEEQQEDGDAKPHVLIVDDDPVMRQLAGFILNTEGYRVSEAENGRAALEFIEHGAPVSVVVLDLDMPELDGLAVLEKLRASRATAALPVIVLTASGQAEAAVMDAGADDYIRKPLEPQSFLARVKAVLRRSTL